MNGIYEETRKKLAILRLHLGRLLNLFRANPGLAESQQAQDATGQ
jgi:hypothetical protein